MQIFHMEAPVIVRQKHLDQPMRFRDRDAYPREARARASGYAPRTVRGMT